MKLGAPVLVLAALALPPAFASAQDPLPSYATAHEIIEGIVASFDGKYALSLSDVRGFTDSVTLRAGTVVAPEGASLDVGSFVRIAGHADGKTFDADEIDTDLSETDFADDGTGDAGLAAYAPPPAVWPAFFYVTGGSYGWFPGRPSGPRRGGPPPVTHPAPAPPPRRLPVDPPRRH